MQYLAITFDDKDMKYGSSRLDEPMVISIVAAKYKIERVLIDQGSLANILYWSTYKKLGLPSTSLDECVGKLYGLAGKKVSIKGSIELKIMLEGDECTWSIPVLYTVVDVNTSYNIILGRPTLNYLGAVVSTLHLCMIFPMGRRVGSVWTDSRSTQHYYEGNLRVGSQSSRTKDSAVNIGPSTAHQTKIMISKEDESHLICFLAKNSDVFAWTLDDMLSIDPSFMCHRLWVTPGVRLVTQKKRKQGEEK
ncbi:hypothetical protein CR513_03640, partial [Mucuna pruriens]